MPEFSAVVVAPTFNNARTVVGCIEPLVAMGLPVVVVNDGSTDDTAARLDGFAQSAGVRVLTHPENRGKAAALRSGFTAAAEMGFTHALTFDTDDQHRPEYAPTLIEAARAQPSALILGRRQDRPERCPWSRRAAWWAARRGFRLLTGRSVRDTQTGLRVYPLGAVLDSGCCAERFAYEMEVLIWWCRASLAIVEIEAPCRYPEDRVSHYRAVRDTVSIGLLLMGLAWRSMIGRSPAGTRARTGRGRTADG